MAALAALAGAVAAEPDPVVHAPAGTVKGRVVEEARAFLGVPFAQAPVGERRWRSPEPLPAWQGTREATAFGASCMQPYPVPRFGPYTAEFLDTPPPAEDCLFLNLWTPRDRGTGLLPVLVWIHGGGFGGGSGAVEIYDGRHLATQGAVVITVNYRVGAFGFLAHPQLALESPAGSVGNYGLEDVVAALRWVRRNVAAFGGDPGRVTIAGQSAGAVAVDDLLVAPEARGLFTAAIAESGSGLGVSALPRTEAYATGQRALAALGVGTVAAARAQPAARVYSQLPLPFLTPPGVETFSFRPVLDGSFLPADPVDGSAPGTSVPLMTGFNADEFLPEASQSPADFEQLVRRRFPPIADRLLKLYPHADAGEATESARTLTRDAIVVAMSLYAVRRRGATSAPTYVYYFEHPLPVASGPSFGTFHTGEVPYVFGTLEPARRPYTEADRAVSRQLQARWLAFMRTGDPNADGLPDWRPQGPLADRVMILGDRPRAGMPVSSPERQRVLVEYAQAGGRIGAL